MSNKLIIAAAGSGKTTHLVEEALKITEGKVLITTYTEANEQEIGSKGGKYEKTEATKREILRRAKAENPRKIELVCLKNRYGISSFKTGFTYYPEFDYFTPDTNYTEE